MAEGNQENEKIYFQTMVVRVINPRTGEKTGRKFIGQSLFTPEELKNDFGDTRIEQAFIEIYLEDPYEIELEGEEPRNVEVHRKLTDYIRKQEMKGQ